MADYEADADAWWEPARKRALVDLKSKLVSGRIFADDYLDECEASDSPCSARDGVERVARSPPPRLLPAAPEARVRLLYPKQFQHDSRRGGWP
jgi:hypothetical protein